MSLDENLQSLNEYKQHLGLVSQYFKMYEIVNNKFTGFKKIYQPEED